MRECHLCRVAGNTVIPCGMWVPVAVWQPCELLYTCYLLTYLLSHVLWSLSVLSNLWPVQKLLNWSGMPVERWLIWSDIRSVVKVDRRIRWHYTTTSTILRLRIGARLTRYRNCKFHNGLVPAHFYPCIRYDTRCYFNVRSRADMSQLNLPHVTNNLKVEKRKTKKKKNGYAQKSGNPWSRSVLKNAWCGPDPQ